MNIQEITQLSKAASDIQDIIDRECDNSNWLTVQEASKELGVSRQRVSKMLKDGVLIGAAGALHTYVPKNMIKNRKDYIEQFGKPTRNTYKKK